MTLYERIEAVLEGTGADGRLVILKALLLNLPEEDKRGWVGNAWGLQDRSEEFRRVFVEEGPTDAPREPLLARLADLLRRAGAEDAEPVIREVEKKLPAVLNMDALAIALEYVNLIPKTVIYRERHGCSLREAMEAIERLRPRG